MKCKFCNFSLINGVDVEGYSSYHCAKSHYGYGGSPEEIEYITIQTNKYIAHIYPLYGDPNAHIFVKCETGTFNVANEYTIPKDRIEAFTDLNELEDYLNKILLTIKYYPRKCKEFGIKPCLVCERFYDIRIKCALVDHKDKLEQSKDIKELILRSITKKLPKNPLYLIAAIRIYFPQYMELYNKLSILQ